MRAFCPDDILQYSAHPASSAVLPPACEPALYTARLNRPLGLGTSLQILKKITLIK